VGVNKTLDWGMDHVILWSCTPNRRDRPPRHAVCHRHQM